MSKRRHFTVYWDEQEEADLMKHLETIARYEKRSKSSTMLVALRQYIATYVEDSDAFATLSAHEDTNQDANS